MNRLLLLSLAIAACSKSTASTPAGNPALTDEMVHPTFGTLRVGHSKLADVQAQFSNATVTKDKSLGGTGQVMLNNAPAIRFETDKVAGYLVGADPVLDTMDVRGYGLCKWVHATVGPVAKASTCRHRMKVIDRETESVICVADGLHEVRIECRAEGSSDELSYQYVP